LSATVANSNYHREIKGKAVTAQMSAECYEKYGVKGGNTGVLNNEKVLTNEKVFEC